MVVVNSIIISLPLTTMTFPACILTSVSLRKIHVATPEMQEGILALPLIRTSMLIACIGIRPELGGPNLQDFLQFVLLEGGPLYILHMRLNYTVLVR